MGNICAGAREEPAWKQAHDTEKQEVKFTHHLGSAAEKDFDSIVFSLNPTYSFAGGLAKEIGEKGGSTVEADVKEKVKKTPAKPSDVIVVVNGNIGSKVLLAVVLDDDKENLKKGVKNALLEA